MSHDGRPLRGALVAAAAGVTATTVGLALGGDGGGSDATAATRGGETTARIAARRFGGNRLGKLGAVVRRTRYGVAHIEAPSYESAAYAMGYLLAEDNICTIADSIVTVSAERSRWFGPDASWSSATARSTTTSTPTSSTARSTPAGPSRSWSRGAAAGTAARGQDRGARRRRRLQRLPARRRRAGGHPRPALPRQGLGAPDQVDRPLPPLQPAPEPGQLRRSHRRHRPARPAGALSMSAARRRSLTLELGRRMRALGGLGSNAYGIGAAATDNGRGMALGNPHLPWAGSERLNQAHIRIPGKADVSGATLLGVPLVLIGHTRGLAWSHTVATAWRFTPFELKLVPGDPHSYLLDGRPRKMIPTRVTVKARRSDGSLEDRSTTLYETVHGPMFMSRRGLPLFPWTPAVGYALGDVNATNFRALNHFFENNQATSVREYGRIQRRYQGIPWVNSLAADRRGEAYYTMNGAIPNVPDAKVQNCPTLLGTGTFPLLGLPSLDGSRSAARDMSGSWGSSGWSGRRARGPA